MEYYSWNFPLPRPHTGMLLGNSCMGAMIWGGNNILRITVGRVDFWDHRGGRRWKPEWSYTMVRELLEQGDAEGIKSLFQGQPHISGTPDRPTVLPVGRLDIDFGRGMKFTKGRLYYKQGRIELAIHSATSTKPIRVELAMDMSRDVLAIQIPCGVTTPEVTPIPAGNYIQDYMQSVSISPPVIFGDKYDGGWVQELPEDPPVCILFRTFENKLLITSSRGLSNEPAHQSQSTNASSVQSTKPSPLTSWVETSSDSESSSSTPMKSAKYSAETLIESVKKQGGPNSVIQAAQQWWQEYWQDVPKIAIPNKRLRFLYYYGMYKFGAMTTPGGFPPGLQGPWIEEYKLPPWSADYHFNINVQMCYWPAYRGNKLAHLKPLWQLITSWETELRRNAEQFIGEREGLKLPHAVDDTCGIVGYFYYGITDQACTGWIAHLMYKQYLYFGDYNFLEQTAFPFMLGAMRVFAAMLEKTEDGAYRLPMSVSPEYGGYNISAWGQNASFHLAVIHRLLEDIFESAAILEEVIPNEWYTIRERLPKASIDEWKGFSATALGPREPIRRITLWEGQALDESHRHHSHLAGLFPFDIIDISDPEWTDVVTNSIIEWIYRGNGLWCAWSLPWAAVIHSRIGNGIMAEHLLEVFARFFTNEGQGTTIDPNYGGYSLMGAGQLTINSISKHNERMQVEGGLAAAAAVMEMLLQTRIGVNHVFAGIPDDWQNVSFKGLRTAGAFIVDASRQNGRVVQVKIQSERGGVFRLANPWDPHSVHLNRHMLIGKSRKTFPVQDSVEGSILSIYTDPGEEITLSGD